MQLLTEELRASLPPLRSQVQSKDPHVYAKFFTPASTWTWFVIEGSAEEDDFIFFGFVAGVEEEWGQFSLSELNEVRGPSEHPIERDLTFKPACLSEVLARDHL